MNGNSYVNLKEILDLFIKISNKKIIIWGTGNMGKSIVENMPFCIEYFVDSNINNLGKEICCKMVKSPENIKIEDNENVMIIVASSYFNEIKTSLIDYGLEEGRNFINGNLLYDFICMCSNEIYSEELRKVFWNLSSDYIYEKWKGIVEDKEVILDILNRFNISSVLDIGCGSGKLMDIYKNVGITRVIGQDIADKSISRCKSLYPEYEFTTTNIEDLQYTKDYFDLTVSRRVLSAIPHDKIEGVLERLSKMTKRIYINEYQELDYQGESSWWFMHNFEDLLVKYGFETIMKTKIKGEGYCHYVMLFERVLE